MRCWELVKSLFRVQVCRRAGVVGRLLRGTVWTTSSGAAAHRGRVQENSKGAVEEGRVKQSAMLC